MTGAVKLNTAGGGSVVVQPASSIASDVTVNVPSVNGDVVLTNVAGTLGLAATGGNIITASTNGTERMRIDSSGNLLVNTTTAETNARVTLQGNNGGRYPLACRVDTTAILWNVAFVNPNGVVGTITTSGSSTAYNTSSDYRLKENIQPMQNALDVVAQLNPVTYTWKADGSDGQGFIAHELQAVVPDCVTGEKDAVDAEGKPVYQGIDTSFLVATLTKAIQELKEQVDAQAAEIATLKGNV